MWLNAYCSKNLLNNFAPYNRLRQIFIAEIVRFGLPFSKQKKHAISNQGSHDLVKSRQEVRSRLAQSKYKKSVRSRL